MNGTRDRDRKNWVKIENEGKRLEISRGKDVEIAIKDKGFR